MNSVPQHNGGGQQGDIPCTQPEDLLCGCVLCTAHDIDFSGLPNRAAVARPAVVGETVPAYVSIAELQRYAPESIHQALSAMDPDAVQAFHEDLPRLEHLILRITRPVVQRMMDADDGMMGGIKGMEVAAESELRDAQADAVEVQACIGQLVAGAALRAYYRANLIRKSNPVATLLSAHSAVHLGAVAVAARRSVQHGGRACTRGDDGDADAAASDNIAAIAAILTWNQADLTRMRSAFCVSRNPRIIARHRYAQNA